MTKAGPFARGLRARARGALAAALAMAALCTVEADPGSAAFAFPFGDSLWSFADAGKAPERLLRSPGASFARSWEHNGAGIVAADTRGGRMLTLKPPSQSESLGSGAWSWAGAGAGLVAAASREYREGFEFLVRERSSAPFDKLEGGTRLDCFVSDALFLPGKLLVAGANRAGTSFSVWQLAPGLARGSASVKAMLAELPRKAGFLRLAGAEGGLYCFVSASTGTASGPLTIWKLSPSGPKAIEPRFASPQPIAWFGSSRLGAKGLLEMPLSLAGGNYALALIDPDTGSEKARIGLSAPLYQWLGSSEGIDYAILYDHARAPGRFLFAALDMAKSRVELFEMP